MVGDNLLVCIDFVISGNSFQIKDFFVLCEVNVMGYLINCVVQDSMCWFIEYCLNLCLYFDVV